MVKTKSGYNSDFNHIPYFAEYVDYLNLTKSEHTVRSYLYVIERFMTHFEISKNEDFEKVTSAEVLNYLLGMKNDGMDKNSVNAHIRVLKAFYNWLLENGFIGNNPIATVKRLTVKPKPKVILTEDEISAIFDACETIEDKAIMAVLLYGGLRRSELVNIQIDDFLGDRLTVIGKGEKVGYVWFPEEVVELLQEYLNTRKHKDSPHFFCSSHKKKYSPETIRLRVKRLATNAGIDEERVEQITPHTMRRTFATRHAENDTNLLVVQKMLRHASSETTKLYALVGDSAVRGAMRNQKVILGKGK